MSDLFDTVRLIARDEQRRRVGVELGVVQEQHAHAAEDDADNYACTVVLRNSGIVLPRVPVATPVVGSAAIPSVGDLVLVQFLGGDLHSPVITGRLYNDEDRPPLNDDGQLVVHLPSMAADDDAVHLAVRSREERSVVLRIGASLRLELRDDDPVVNLDVGDGKAVLRIDADGAVTLESGGDLALVGNAVQIRGSEVNVEADASLTLKGARVDIN